MLHNKYIQLEKTVRETYNLNKSDSISYYLSRKDKFRKFRHDIHYCQEVRNWLQHNEKINKDFAITPNDVMIDFIDSLIERIKSRSKCPDICIKVNDVYYQNIDGNIQTTIKVMRKNCFTHIPILKDNIVVGIFDENSVFNYIADNIIVMIDQKLKFSDIKQYLSIDDRKMESFVFMPYDSYVEELEDLIEMEFKKGKRIGMALLTSDGNKTSPLMGIITPWDIIQSER